MLNRALSTMEVDIIIKIGFLLHDLHQNIVQLHTEQYADQTHSTAFIVYCDQELSQKDFEQLMNTKSGPM
jgi:hypothetical protein